MKYPELTIVHHINKSVNDIPEERLIIIHNSQDILSKRLNGEFENRAFYLDDHLEWVLGKDFMGVTILVPLGRS